jgi:hypothetical protein
MARSPFSSRTHVRARGRGALTGPGRRAPTGGGRRRLAAAAVALLAIVAIVAVVVALVSSGGGPSVPHRGLLESMFQDDQYLLYEPSDAVVAHTLDGLKALGVDRIKVQVLWGALAPDPLSPTVPHGFDATNPAAYPASHWAPFDRLLSYARARGMGVDFDVTAPGPLWAMRQGDPDRATALNYAPSVHAFEQFATALGRRYSGSYTPPGARTPLPRVDYWSIWNEPNQPGWLAPQLRVVRGVRVPDSPRLYREYANAAFKALESTGHTPSTDTILIGETAPEGCNVHGAGCIYMPDFEPVTPVPFIESLYCVDANFKPLRGSLAVALHCPLAGRPQSFVAANPALFQATGYAHHPYSLSLAPNIPFASNDYGFIAMAELPELEHMLDRIFATYGVRRQLPLYLTEYGYETDPPNPIRGVKLRYQSAWLNEAQYMAWKDPRVRVLSQFLLADSKPDTHFPVGSPGYWSTFQTGLLFANLAPKPSLNSYRLPIFLPATSFHVGDSVEVWAMLRPAANGTEQHAVIQWRPLHGAYALLETVSTDDPSGALVAYVRPPASGAIRVQWTPPSGRAIDSRAVGVFAR